MTTNRIIYRIKEALRLDVDEILRAYELESYPMDRERLLCILARRNGKGICECTYEELGVFLDGLITLKRGPSPHKPQDETPLTYNLIMKKLRIALQLVEEEIEIIFHLGELPLSRSQIRALFRNEAHKNFKPCDEKTFKAFLAGLEEFYYNVPKE